LSNQKGEGFENKIAEVLGKAFGSGVQYYWRPSFERGTDAHDPVGRQLRRLDEHGVRYRRRDCHQAVVSLDVRVRLPQRQGFRHVQVDGRSAPGQVAHRRLSGVAVRQALAQHGVMANTVIHYLSHNGDLVEENQPSYQIQQVIDGKLDIAAAWGPMAGYYKTIKHAPLTIQPVNTIDNTVPLEFDMALAVPRGRPDIAKSVEQALTDRKGEIKKILDDYGVPLVQCEDCIVSGNLPSHGPYKSQAQTEQQTAEASDAARVTDEGVTLAQLKEWLANGADPNEELGNAILGQDLGRVGYLLEHGADVNTRFGDGYTPLISAVRFGFDKIACVSDRAQGRRQPCRLEQVDAGECMRMERRCGHGARTGQARRKARHERARRHECAVDRRAEFQAQVRRRADRSGRRRESRGRNRRLHAADACVDGRVRGNGRPAAQARRQGQCEEFRLASPR
jgi:hypothetical protein